VVATGGEAVRGREAAQHFSYRVMVTLRQHLDIVRQLHARVEAANARVNAPTGLASTLSPLDALRYLTTEQKSSLCEGLVRDQLAAARRDREVAAAELSAARRVTAELRLTLLRLAGDVSTPNEARSLLERALVVLDNPVLDQPPPDETTRAVRPPESSDPSGPADAVEPAPDGPVPSLSTLGDLFSDGGSQGPVVDGGGHAHR